MRYLVPPALDDLDPDASTQRSVASFHVRITRAGEPAAMLFAGTSFVTTLFAPMMASSPILTPGMTTTFWPSHAPRPMRIGAIQKIPWYR